MNAFGAYRDRLHISIGQYVSCGHGAMKTSLSLDLSISVNTVLFHAWSKQEIDSQIFRIVERVPILGKGLISLRKKDKQIR